MMHLAEAIQSIDVSIYTWLGGFAGNWVLDRLASHEEGNPIFKGGLFSRGLLVFVVSYWLRSNQTSACDRYRCDWCARGSHRGPHDIIRRSTP